MDRGFLSGLAAGLVLVVGGGIVVSELAPPPAALLVIEPGAVKPTAVKPAAVKPAAGEAEAAANAVAGVRSAEPAPEPKATTAMGEPAPRAAGSLAVPESEAGAVAPTEPAAAASKPGSTAETARSADPTSTSEPTQNADPVAVQPSVQAGEPASAAEPTANASPAEAEPMVQAGEPVAPQTPIAATEPVAPPFAAPQADASATAPGVAAPTAPTAPAMDQAQARQPASEKLPQPQVGNAAASLATTAALVESPLPTAGEWAEIPKVMRPGVVALPASDGPAMAAAPATIPAATSDAGATPATPALDLSAGAAPQAEQSARIGVAASLPQQPGTDAAPGLIAKPNPLPADPISAEPAPLEVAEASPDTGQADTTAAPAEKPGILVLTDHGMPNGTNAPKPGFADEAAGVKIIRPAATKPLPAARADAAARTDAAARADAAVDEDASPALVRNAADFANQDGKPLMSVILIDDGSQDPAKIIGLGFPVTIALDPTRAGATDAAASYRAAGLEVLILATALPAGATAADLEVTFQSHFNALPQAVGVLDLPLAGFQDNRILAQQIIGILGEGGYGLVTIDKGLNPAAQVAMREKLAQARVFRELDASGENVPAIRRYLDRAAFRGAQEGVVVVLGHTSNDTLQALVEWAAEGRAANMALCPISAAMSGV